MEGKNGDILNYAETTTQFYIAPEASGSSVISHKGQAHIGYLQATSPIFYMSAFGNNDFYLQYAGSTNWNYKPPTIEEKIAEQIQLGYQEVVPKWYVQQNTGVILHLCEQEEVQGYPPDLHQALILNKAWHNHNVICSKCHQPAPSKVFFLSETVK